MKVRASDFFLTVMMLSVVLGSGWMLYQELNQKGINAGTAPVGRVKALSNDLERRFLNDTRWIKLGKDDILYQFDSVRTGRESNCLIAVDYMTQEGKNFNSTINLQESTFVTLSFTDSSTIELESGALSTDKALGESDFLVRLGDKVVSTSGAIDVSRSASGESEVIVKNGRASISANGVTEKLGKNESAQLQEGRASIKKQQMWVVPRLPQKDTNFLIFEKSKKVLFKWDVLKSSKEGLMLEVSEDRNFEEARQFNVLGQTQYEAKIEQGQYYWRLASFIEGKPHYSQVNSFNIRLENPIVAIAPNDGKIFNYQNKIPKIRFGFTSAVYAKHYLVEVARDSEFNDIYYTNDQLKRGTFDLDTLESGNWYWRVRPFYSIDGVGYGPYTMVRHFSIVQRDELRSPLILFPKENHSFMKGLPSAPVGSALAGDTSIRFSWTKDPEIQEYLLTIWYSEGKKSSPLYQVRQSLNFKTLKLIEFDKIGRYFWQVEGFGVNQNLIPGSKAHKFEITRFNVTLNAIYPANNEALTLQENDKILFQWNSNLDKNFTLDIYKDNPQPPSLITFENLGKRSQKVAIQTAGIYYWQVTYQDSIQRLSSKLYQFRVFTPLKAPSIISPIPAQNIILSEDEGITFRWKAISNAQSYQVVLFRGKEKQPFLKRDNLIDSYWKIDNISSFTKGSYRLSVRAWATGLKKGVLRYSPISTVNFNVSKVLVYNPARLVSPTNRKTISLDTVKEHGIQFKWDQRPLMNYFYLDISSTDDFKQIDQSIYSDATTAVVDIIDAGDYFWRIRSFDAEDKNAPVSLTQRFRVVPSTRKYPPILQLPRNKISYSVKQEKAGIQFSWDGNEKYLSWRFQLASDAGFKNMITNEQVFGKRMTVRSQMHLGEWYWRIGAIGKSGRVDIYSQSRMLKIKELKGKISPIYPVEDMELETNGYGEMEFQWASDFSGPFRFQLFNDRRPTIPITVLNTPDNKIKTLLPGSGRYFWQVLVVDKSGTVFKTGKKYLFTAHRPLLAVEIISPAPNSAYLYKKVKNIDFAWKAVPEAQSYKISIIDNNNDSIIIEEEVNEVTWTFKNVDLLPVGSYQIKCQPASLTHSGEQRVGAIAKMGFSITRPLEGMIPKLNKPNDQSVIDRLKIMERGLKFNWSATEVGVNYWLEIAKDSDFRDIYRYRKLDNNYFQFDDFDPGNYHWRVRVENPVNKSQLNSKSFSFSVKGLPVLTDPILTTPSASEIVYMDYAQSLDFQWLKVKGADSYEISCYTKNNDIVFEKIVVSKPMYQFKQLEKLDVGNFYCIIKALGFVGIQKIKISSQEIRFEFSIGLKSEISTPDILSPEVQYAK